MRGPPPPCELVGRRVLNEIELFSLAIFLFLFLSYFFFASDRRASACRERKSPLGGPENLFFTIFYYFLASDRRASACRERKYLMYITIFYYFLLF